MKTEDELIQEFIELIDDEIEEYDFEPLITDAFLAFRRKVVDLYQYVEDDSEE